MLSFHPSVSEYLCQAPRAGEQKRRILGGAHLKGFLERKLAGRRKPEKQAYV
jgi:hypothetical protein